MTTSNPRSRLTGSAPRAALVVLAGCAFAAAPTHAAAPYALDGAAIVSGAPVSGNSCSRLSATLGEPAAGFSSGGGFSLSAGFQSMFAAGDNLFFDGFEGCRP
jgi:hypothetical protein